MMRTMIGLAVVLTLLVLTAATPAAQPSAAATPTTTAAAPTPITLRTEHMAFAFDPGAGNLVGIESGGTVTLYPRAFLDGKSTDKIETKTGNRLTEVLFKRYKDKSFFIVMADDGKSMVVLDAATLKPAGKITMSQVDGRSIVTSLATDDPWVYFVFSREKGLNDGVIGRASLADMTDKGEIRLTSRADSIGEIAISADGQILYTRNPRYGPSGFNAHGMSRDPKTGEETWNQVYREHKSSPGYVPDPFNLWTAAGTTLYSRDLKTSVAALPLTPQCFFTTMPVMVGFEPLSSLGPTRGRLPESPATLAAASLNDFHVLGRVPLPAEFVRSVLPQDIGADGVRAFPAKVFADDTGKRVIAVSGRLVLVVPLADLAVTPVPFLVSQMELPPVVSATEPLKIPLRLMDKRCKVTVKAGPEGAAIDGEFLVWTPKLSQVGEAAIELRLAAGDVERAQTFRTNVSGPSIELGFTATQAALDPSGKRVLVWGTSESRSYDADRRPAETRLAVVDLEKRLVVSRQIVPQVIRAAVLTEDRAILAPQEADRLDALPIEKLEGGAHVLTEGHVTALQQIGPKTLMVLTEKKIGAYGLPDLSATATPIFVKTFPNEIMASFELRRYTGNGQAGLNPFPIPYGDGWLASGILYNADLSKVRLISLSPFYSVAGFPASRPDVAPIRWNRFIDGDRILSSSGQMVARMNYENRMMVLDDYPVAALVSAAITQQRTTVTMKLCELTSGRQVEQITLLDQPTGANAGQEDRVVPGQIAMTATGRQIVVLVNHRLFTHTLSDETLKACKPPLLIELSAEVSLISLDKPTKLEHKVIGGEGPITFKVDDASNTAGAVPRTAPMMLDGEPANLAKVVTLDTATGTVTVDGPALAEQVMASVGRATSALAQGRPGAFLSGYDNRTGAFVDPESQLSKAIEEAAPNFKRFFGREPKGLPVSIPISLDAVDKTQQTAHLQYWAVIEMPTEPILKSLREQKEKRAAEQKKRDEENQKMRDAAAKKAADAVEAAKVRDASAPLPPNVELHILRLEKRIADLEDEVRQLRKAAATPTAAPAPTGSVAMPINK
jgi:hypothetical protein